MLSNTSVMNNYSGMSIAYCSTVIVNGYFYANNDEISCDYLKLLQYGDNISEIRNAFVEAHFSLSTALRIGIAALEALEELHNLGYVHRDVKGSNFITNYSLRDSHANRSGNVKVYLIDFGLCRKISDLPNGVENGVSTSHFRGTTRYASLSAHNGLEQSPRDDLESWFYMLIEMITGELPWAHLHKAEREEVKKMKEDARTRDGLHRLLKGCPKVEFRRILNYIDSLTCSSQPDDKFIKQLLQLAMKNYGCKMDEPLDWED
ncbi:hypothetical protein AB6A40_010860 [Gnathostoma spinigerum]|uniref:non-specific serine/threonine protein kinase n=1 Tax=Gnathostoma spinigerum TaxID=75299 RepID=A0ABD6EXU1_9BILA